LLALAQEKCSHSLALVRGVFRALRLQDDRQNSATGVTDVADCFGWPAVNFQLIEILAETIQRRLVFQTTAHAVFHCFVDFCL
jgi:hypothetical protein